MAIFFTAHGHLLADFFLSLLEILVAFTVHDSEYKLFVERASSLPTRELVYEILPLDSVVPKCFDICGTDGAQIRFRATEFEQFASLQPE